MCRMGTILCHKLHVAEFATSCAEGCLHIVRPKMRGMLTHLPTCMYSCQTFVTITERLCLLQTAPLTGVRQRLGLQLRKRHRSHVLAARMSQASSCVAAAG